jgi:hypothetical protein
MLKNLPRIMIIEPRIMIIELVGGIQSFPEVIY